jgi:hypothetical protein
MFLATPGAPDALGHRLTRDAAETLARNWTTLLLNALC